jgi:hypothetical protein
MPRVVALYRYPLKGFTPEKCDTLTVLPKGESPVTGFSGFASPIRKHPMMRGAAANSRVRHNSDYKC